MALKEEGWTLFPENECIIHFHHNAWHNENGPAVIYYINEDRICVQWYYKNLFVREGWRKENKSNG